MTARERPRANRSDEDDQVEADAPGEGKRGPRLPLGRRVLPPLSQPAPGGPHHGSEPDADARRSRGRGVGRLEHGHRSPPARPIW
jgi:hypothetical protein